MTIAPPPKIRVYQTKYAINGRSFPRISSVLDIIAAPQLKKWREEVGDDEADRISKASTDLGTAIHAACERIAHDHAQWKQTGEWTIKVEDELLPHVQPVWDWFADDVEDVLFTEETVWCTDPVYAGTIDLVVRRKNGRIALADYKSSKSLRAKYRMQTAAYIPALHERHGIWPDDRFILHVPSNKPGTFRIKKYVDFDDDWNAFQAALFLTQYTHYYRRDFME